MQLISINIILAFILIIPFHGIFIALFFFNKSHFNLSPNFFLGSLLFVISSLILLQLIYIDFFYLCELLTCPFLFLYNSKMIRPGASEGVHSHLVIIVLVLLIFLLILITDGPANFVITVIFIIINGLYLAGSVILLIGFINSADFGWKDLQPSMSGIIIFNLLIIGTLLLSIFLRLTHPVSVIYYAQIPKALAIYYIYYQILKSA